MKYQTPLISGDCKAAVAHHTAIDASAPGDLLEQVPEGRPQWTRGHPIVDDLNILAHRHAGAEACLEAQRDVAEALKQAMMPPFQDCGYRGTLSNASLDFQEQNEEKTEHSQVGALADRIYWTVLGRAGATPSNLMRKRS